jgi:hypothetical protein
MPTDLGKSVNCANTRLKARDLGMSLKTVITQGLRPKTKQKGKTLKKKKRLHRLKKNQLTR